MGFKAAQQATYQTLFNEEAKQDSISHFPQILEADSLQFCIFNNVLQLMVKKFQDPWNQKRSRKKHPNNSGARTRSSDDYSGTLVTLGKQTKSTGNVGESHMDQD